MADRRVVVTGMGVLAANGIGVDAFWSATTAGRGGIGPTTRIDPEQHATSFCGEVDLDDVELTDGDRRGARRKDRYSLLAIKAAAEAMAMAGLEKGSLSDPFRIGVVVGSGIGGLRTIELEHAAFVEKGPRRVSAFLVPKMIVDSAAGDISIVYGAKGPNYSITTACATGSHSIGAALNHIRAGQCDVMICGGAEAPISHLGFAGFNSIGALSKRNDSPETASRPFDRDRDGFVMAEGAGVLVLEEYEHARKRGATIYGEVAGAACNGDAFHETAPDTEGISGAACMHAALADAGITPDQLGYLNAHGTSTPPNDKTETLIIKKVFGDHARSLSVSSTKGVTGHALGAAGGIEAIATILALRDGVLPPTANYTTPDPECDLDYIPNEARELQVDYGLSNNLGFGGHNACVVFKRFTG